MSRLATAVAVGLLALALAAGCGGAGRSSDGQLPADDAAPGWRRADAVRSFSGADLYNHIDGGAEVFLELGFERLQVQRYASDRGELELELYRMTDPLAALGIYLMKCGVETPDPALAARHTVGPYQLQLVRGRCYLSINLLDGAGLDDDMVALARSVVASVPAADAQQAFAELPSEGRVPGSERVLRGRSTLEALYSLGEGDPLGLEEGPTGVAAAYETGGRRSTRIRVRHADDDAARAAFSRLVAALDPALEIQSRQPDRIVFRDYASAYGVLARDGSAIDVTVNLEEPPP